MARGPWLLRIMMKVLERLYIFAESKMSYPDDAVILGVPIDEDLQKMSRKELCDYIMVETVGSEGGDTPSFWELESTTKIRFGAQMMRNGIQQSQQ